MFLNKTVKRRFLMTDKQRCLFVLFSVNRIERTKNSYVFLTIDIYYLTSVCACACVCVSAVN